MEHHKYVPCFEKTEIQRVPGTCEIEEVSVPVMHHIMFGGDHITKVRAMSAIKQRVNTDTPVDRCEGIIPVIEDWHMKLTLFEVKIIALYHY